MDKYLDREIYCLLFRRMFNGFAIQQLIKDEAGKLTDCRFLEVNTAFLEITGLNTQNIIGKTWQEVWPQLDLFWLETFRNAAYQENIFEGYIPEFSKHLKVEAHILEPDYLVISIEDITKRVLEQKNFSQEFDKLKNEYEELYSAYEKLSAITYETILDVTHISVSKQKLEKALKQANDLSTIDYLTGILNRAGFENQLREVVKQAGQESQTMGIIIADIDYFKQVNDTFGHQTGDEVLVRFAITLSQFCCTNELVGRYGGEEFIICLPNASVEKAVLFAEKLRIAIAEQLLFAQDTLSSFHVTASFGVAAMRVNGMDSIDILIGQADKALYQAKAGGRNCVHAAQQ